MARSINKIQEILITVIGGIRYGDGLALDGYSAFALDIHTVGHLFVIISRVDYFCFFDKAVSKRGFPVIYMCNDTEIPYVLGICHIRTILEI